MGLGSIMVNSLSAVGSSSCDHEGVTRASGRYICCLSSATYMLCLSRACSSYSYSASRLSLTSSWRYVRWSSTFTLRPYQEACLDACFDALDAGVRRIGVSLPTGAGKTAVFISLLSRLEAKNADARRSLVVVNSIELARQTAVLAQKLRPDWSVEIEQGAKYNASGRADLCVLRTRDLSEQLMSLAGLSRRTRHCCACRGWRSSSRRIFVLLL